MNSCELSQIDRFGCDKMGEVYLFVHDEEHLHNYKNCILKI